MRHIGIRHRVKKTAAGEARPTEIAISEDGVVRRFNLEDEQAEFDFVHGVFPLRNRAVTPEDTLDGVLSHHVEWSDKKLPELWPLHLTRKSGKKVEWAKQIPAAYEGIRDGDIVGMILGGSGDYLALGIAEKAKDYQHVAVRRIPPANLKYYREQREMVMKDDAALIATLLIEKPHRFYDVLLAEEAMTFARECQRRRIDTMKARVAAEQRLRQASIGRMFRDRDLWKAGTVKAIFSAMKSSDTILTNLEEEEKLANQSLEYALRQVPFFVHLKGLPGGVGVGPAIAGRLLADVIDIRRFQTADKLVKYAGVHVNKDGTFPRFRRNMKEDEKFSPGTRQALYLVAEQWRRRPNSLWGQKLLENKRRYRERHPEPIMAETANGKKKRYTDGHIQKMAIWRTLTQYVRWLHGEWTRFEKERTMPASTTADDERKAA